MSCKTCSYDCNGFEPCPPGSIPTPPISPEGATPLRTCDELGVCQYRAPTCSGACEHPLLNGQSWQTAELTPHTWDQFAHQVCVVAVYGASTGIALGAVTWLWNRFGDDLQRLYGAALALWF